MNPNAQGFDPSRLGSSSSVSGGISRYPQQYSGMQQHSLYDEQESGGAYDPSTGYQPAFYSQQTSAVGAYNNHDAWASDTIPQDGSYYPTVPNVLQPQLYGAPISALGYDEEYEAIYVTSQTQSLKRNTRASMMATHSTLDGMLYSACAVHPEASPFALDAVYESFYRYPSSYTASTNNMNIPSHAYQPFGSENSVGGYSKYHLGVTTLMPMKGYVASVSPAAVRVHTHGGLCISDAEIEGMVAGCLLPGHVHVSVGGVAIGKYSSHVHRMDMYQNLRVVSSTSFRTDSADSTAFGVMCMAANEEKQTLVAGCSDGTLRLLDGSFRSRGRTSELAKVKSHSAGVSNVAVSPDGNLVCTTGFASRSPSNATVPYAYTDHNVYIYDVRYLGRGGILHPFSAVNGGPRLCSFIPDVADQPTNRVLVASGQNKGGIQIITPFDTTGATDFLVPQLAHRETMTALHVSGQYLAIGTSQSNVLQYEMAGWTPQGMEEATSSSLGANAPEFIPGGGGYIGTTGTSSSSLSGMNVPTEKKPLVLPPYTPEPPAMSIDPSILQSTGDPGMRTGASDRLKSIFTAYTMLADPKMDQHSAFASFANTILLAPAPKRNVSKKLLMSSSKMDGDVMSSVMTSDLGVDLFENEKKDKNKQDEGLPNPNRTLHSKKLSTLCYEKSEARATTQGSRGRRNQNKAAASQRGRPDGGSGVGESDDGIPKRYRMTVKPSHSSRGATFSHAQYNDTGLWPGWDYPPSMPNAYAPPVLLWLYFVPEIRSAMMTRQFDRAGKRKCAS